MMVSKVLKISMFISVVSILSGCAHMDEAASHVQVVNGNNAFTSQCKMLGPVSDEQSEWAFATPGETQAQVLINLRSQAYKMYGADTIAVQSFGRSGFSTDSGSAIALKCIRSELGSAEAPVHMVIDK
ncbi:DUF4156 domain-containing protein [Citrobacter portucalensis]|uniref:DUF4156 domain-containing protein n=1 Tax=Citrobacter freundii complex TaxID=1344959 RepID=UPI00226B3C03|nr:DUF4156 domain-containing protein [Citrobacter portucalensis]MCX9067890.1 DUF4156 domain-containing protein [Citrobacter portucalensis]MEB0898310.1 DUF4156 domain-containing protein [Citrobacter portucalensis]